MVLDEEKNERLRAQHAKEAYLAMSSFELTMGNSSSQTNRDKYAIYTIREGATCFDSARHERASFLGPAMAEMIATMRSRISNEVVMD
jgi:hypothetical protein